MTDDPETAPLPAPIQSIHVGLRAEAGGAKATGPAGGPAPAHAPAPRLGLAAEIAGVVGFVVFIALAVGVLLARGWAAGAVDDVESGIDARIAKAVPLLDTTSGKVAEVSGRLGVVAEIAVTVANSPSPAQVVVQKLLTEVANVSDRYMALRNSYADARESSVAVLDRLQMLDRIAPGISVPQGPVNELAALDTKIRDLDTAVTGLTSSLPQDGLANQAADVIATRVGEVDAALNGLSSKLEDAKRQLTDLRKHIASTADTVSFGITIGSFGIVLLCVWIAVLHWVLFRTGRQLRRAPAAAA